MEAERWERIKDVFAEASDMEADKRSAFLETECSGDPELRAEIDSLLASSDADSLIETHSLDLASLIDGEEDHAVGKRIGNYVIVGEIGRGGMGTVYLAERADGEFKQQVALKLVRQTIADSENAGRFRREREILASLTHPNIASLHDGGVTKQGEPFFAMEYVDGDSLIRHAERYDLSLRDRLVLFLRICNAVAYAHRHLTVHRDIKPSNILVTPEGEPKLLDFGLARIIDESSDHELTATAYRAFTPAYASPEQILGKRVTTASDIYSLGAVLYELLTGQKPFDLEGKSLEELVQTLTDSEPVKPSLLAGKRADITSDIDNIVLKCLEKEPERRYASVEDLGADIRRFLDGRPIAARPSTFRYRAVKFFRRNKIAVSAAAVVLVSLIAGLVASLWQANAARIERDRAQRRFEDVRKLSTSLMFEIAPKIEGLSGSTEARELLVTRATEYLDSLAGETTEDPLLTSELASAYEKVGDLQGNPVKPNLGDFAGAIESYDKAYALRTSLNFGDRRALAENRAHAAAIRFAQSDVKGSLANSEEALALYKPVIEAAPEDLALRNSFLQTKMDYGQTFANNNQYETAVPILEQVVSELRTLDGTNREVKILLARANGFLASSLSWDDRQPEAEAVMREAVAEAQALEREAPNDPVVQKTLWRVYMLESSIYENVKNDVSYAAAKRALVVANLSAAADPADSQAQHNVARTLSRTGNTAALIGHVEEGRKSILEAERILLQLLEREPKNVIYRDDLGSLYTRLGDVYKKEGSMDRSLEAFQRSADVFANLAAKDEKNTVAIRDWAQALKNVAFLNAAMGKKDEAIKNYEHAIGLVDRLKEMHALGKYDEPIFEQMHAELAKLRS